MRNFICILALCIMFPPVLLAMLGALLVAFLEWAQYALYEPAEKWVRNSWYGRCVVEPALRFLEGTP